MSTFFSLPNYWLKTFGSGIVMHSCNLELRVEVGELFQVEDSLSYIARCFIQHKQVNSCAYKSHFFIVFIHINRKITFFLEKNHTIHWHFFHAVNLALLTLKPKQQPPGIEARYFIHCFTSITTSIPHKAMVTSFKMIKMRLKEWSVF